MIRQSSLKVVRFSGATCPPTTESTREGLRDVFESGRNLLLVGRNSNSSGRAGAQDAAEDLHEAARQLRDRFQLDVLSALPSIHEITAALMSVQAEKTVEPGGNVFKNRFIAFSCEEMQLVLSVSAGSARKTDERGRQPHAEHLESVLWDQDLNIGALYAKRSDRLSRDAWSFKQVLRPLECLFGQKFPAWAACDSRELVLDGSQDLNIFVDGYTAEREAKDFASKRSAGAKRWTGSELNGDHCLPVGVGRAVPPGMMRIRFKATGRSAMTFDTPGCYPDQSLLTSVLPNLRTLEGGRVDQVENVRWFWGNLPKLGIREAMRGLYERKYSTQSLRDQRDRGPESHYGSEDDPFDDPDRSWDAAHSLWRSLRDNFAFYRDGILELKVQPGESPIRVTDVFPPDGPWMSEATALKVAAYLEEMAVTKPRTRRRWSWSRFPILINGHAGELRAPQEPSDPDVRWRVVPVSAAIQGQQFPTLPDKELMGAITSAVLAARGEPLRRLADPAEDDATAQLRQKLERLEADLTKRKRRHEAKRLTINEEDPESGELVMPLEFRRRAMADWEAEHQAIEDLKCTAQAVARELREARAESGVEISVLEKVLNQLRRESTVSPARDELRRAVGGLSITYERVLQDRIRGYRATLSGELRIAHDGDVLVIPFTSVYQVGAVAQAQMRVAALAHDMRHGIVPTTQGGRISQHRPINLLATTLGVPSTEFRLGRCLDADLLRLGMAIFHPDPLPGEDPAHVPSLADLLADSDLRSDFGNLEKLVANIRATDKLRTRWWLFPDRPRHESMLILRGAGLAPPETDSAIARRERDRLRTQAKKKRPKGSIQRYGRWQFPREADPFITPCPHCGSLLCAPVRLPEVAGLLCLQCRRDESGIRWPKRFDSFIASLDAWVAAGVVEAPAVVTPAPTGQARVKQWRDLTRREIDQLGKDYTDRRLSIKEVAAKSGVEVSTLYILRRREGWPHRYRGLDKTEKALEVGGLDGDRA